VQHAARREQRVIGEVLGRLRQELALARASARTAAVPYVSVSIAAERPVLW
jgi:hypothetical protein